MFLRIISTIFLLIFSLSASAAVEAGKVLAVSGQLNAMALGGEKRSLKKGAIFYTGDQLMTGPKARAKLLFLDKTSVLMMRSASIKVKDYHYVEAQPKQDKLILGLIKGGLRTVTGALAKRSPKDYQIDTPVGTVSVRGTDYTLVINNGKLFVGVWQGRVLVKNKGGHVEVGKGGSAVGSYAEITSNIVKPKVMRKAPEVLRKCRCKGPVAASRHIVKKGDSDE